ncbi:PREDICTED: protein suppressor of variegation 3-7 isoform X1 [Drosophila arizonae]|uniref:Protein suppressor of variegation 3-7 isoform X1 n=1 Tax=Drosophila arizonae TaxID=7263 RepID=A0ABM1Q306_DROAR|nr:PREDICTED: protein suppressor of variegation 3-7 isoform X1 [Drosophila arizonae]
MESPIAQIAGNSVPNASDAGNTNKMASSTSSKKSPTDVHELKIMEVEGATEETLVIELDDDDGDEGASVGEKQTANVNNASEDKSRDDEKTSTKTEPSSDGESATSYNGPDPMGLLEPIDSSKEADYDDDDEEEESADEASSSGSRRISRGERWQIWMKRWPWLLHEESDGEFAFCLYCNVIININKKLKYIQQHNLSLYHQERESNYLAFKNSDEYKQSELVDQDIKHEFGTDNYVAAMKRKRANEVEKLNDFNWQRWLNWHDWLERTQKEGTVGLCKCCNVRMNVEFVYLRKRHETSKGHCEAQRSMEKRKRKLSGSESDNADNPAQELRDSGKATAEDTLVMTVVDSCGESTDPSDWCELLPETNPQQCRCTLCDCRMAITSFMRHLKTKVHCSNLIAFKKKQLSKMNRGIWAKYAEQHPWIVADPSDPSIAYCHVCSRRFIYGHSEIKRKNHENSEKHQAAVAATIAVNGEEQEQEQEEEEQSEQEQSDPQTEGSDDDYIQEDDKLSTSQRSSPELEKETVVATSKAKPVVRQFPWLRYSKDRKIQICKFCRVRFHKESNKVRHEQSARHKKLAAQFKARQAARRKEARRQRKLEEENDNGDQSNEESVAVTVDEDNSHSVSAHKALPKPVFKAVPATMQGKVMVWKDRFPWLSYKRSEARHNYGWCKLCEVSVFLPSFKYASKHQRSSRHVRLRFERKRVARMPPTSAAATTAPASSALPTGEAKHKAAMAELQAKYDWLEPDVNDENYCHCKLCETRLPIKIFFLRQHDGARKHLEQLERLRNTSEITTITTTEADRAASVMDVDQESDEELSVNPLLSRSECSTGEQPPAKRARRSMEIRRILRALRDSAGKRSDERSQLDMAKDMICSSFDIVSRLRTLERENDSPANTSSHNCSLASVSVAQPRDTMELFFESITQTMKSLPSDLAAEGKAKIMQIVCDLELRGIQRNAPVPAADSAQSRDKVTVCTPKESEPVRLNFEEDNRKLQQAPESPESASPLITLEDLPDEPPAQIRLSSSNNHTPEPSQSSAPVEHTAPTAANISVPSSDPCNGRSQEVMFKVRRFLTSSNSKPEDSVRVVPINKLTTVNANFGGARANGPNTVRAQSKKSNHAPPNVVVMNTPPSSNSDVSNGSTGSTPVFRRIHNNNTIVLPVQNSGQAQQVRQQKPSQQQLPQSTPRYSNAATNTQQHIQDQARRQYVLNRPVVQPNRPSHPANM